MNTLPFAQIGIWGFSFFVSLLTLCFGGPGVLDQGADFTLRDSDVPQTLKKKNHHHHDFCCHLGTGFFEQT